MATVRLVTEGWLESRQGWALYVAQPRQRLDTERERRLDEAIGRFVNDVIPLNLSADEVQARVADEFARLVPRKRA